jgi:hypothetical protein
MLRRLVTVLAATPILVAGLGIPAAHATPVCTDGYKGGPPLALCGGRIFPESYDSTAYVQYAPQPGTGFREYADGVAFMAQKYPRWVSVSTLRELTGSPLAVSAGPDGKRSTDPDDTGDGRDIYVIRLTDHEVPAPRKQHLFFSLSVHGNERGGLEGGLRAVEDLAIAATNGGTISDGVAGYATSTGTDPQFHTYDVKDVLAKEDVWFIDFNIDGWEVGDLYTVPTAPFERGNSIGTDLNRQMPTIGRIDSTRNPLEESETRYGTQLMNSVAASGVNGKLAYGADIHGELTSRAYVDIMYPAGQFNSVKHRQLMAIAERTKSVIDATLYDGIQNQIENQTGGDGGEGIEGPVCDFVPYAGCHDAIANTIPTMPAHWATVWDTLGYTDTGFIGDYLAMDLGVTGMDYEIFLNHTVPDKTWDVYLQENHINASRAIVKTAMAYALFQDREFKDFRLETAGQPGYVFNPAVVTDADGVVTKPGPDGDGLGANGKPVPQAHYRATNMTFFTDESKLMTKPFVKLLAADIADNPKALDAVDTLVLADFTVPKDALGRPVDKAKYLANITSWVKRGGNLVLTDRALHALGDLGVVSADDVEDIEVYQPYSDMNVSGEDSLVKGLRANARQLVEAAILGYGIGDSASPMTSVAQGAFESAGGHTVGTTGAGRTTLGWVSLGGGVIRIIGGALPTPSEDEDHRYGLRDYALTYSGLFIMENAIKWDASGLGVDVPTVTPPTTGGGDQGGSLPTTGWAGETVALLAAVALSGGVLLRRYRQRRQVPNSSTV